jgi:hypothetical protein
VSFTDGPGVKHNFCPKGDVDLSYFYVKAGRSYKVQTKALANGVDTVMAVGDLNPSTPCMPAGCWNDDEAALTFASRIDFTAVEDDTALITVSNRGGKNGNDATYELIVVEYVPTPTPTITAGPSGTWTATPTATVTPRPLIDRCERYGGTSGNNTCITACPNFPVLGIPYFGTIYPLGDEDWFAPATLTPGEYELTLVPPDDQDYEMAVRANDTRNGCQILTYDGKPLVAFEGGEGEPEVLRWTVTADTRITIQVLASGSYADPYNPYSLLLRRTEATAVPTSLTPPSPVPPTATDTPTYTPSPTLATFMPPIITSTPTPTPTATQPSTLSGHEPARP